MAIDTETREVVRYEVEDRCALITIDRPQARNAVSPEVAEGIEAAIDAVEADEDVWVAILTGVPPVFCAGADLRAIEEGRGTLLSTARGGFAGIVRRERSKPVIAAVEGAALAGGTEIVLSCDLVVAAADAVFGIPEVKRGLVAAAGGLFRLGRKLPIAVAMECTLTGDPIDAARAYGFGLVNELAPPGQAVEAARALAARITANAPLAVSESRKVVIAGTSADDETGWRLTEEANQVVMGSEDVHEGIQAFIEKRPPAWKGR